MKATFILFISMCLLGVIGCSSSKDAAGTPGMKLTKAIYEAWSQVPNRGDVPEKGIDLRVTIKNWPEGYKPLYMVFHQRQSFIASVADSSDGEVTIRARIIKASSMLRDKSESTQKSDRLVYKDDEGKVKYLKIDHWERK